MKKSAHFSNGVYVVKRCSTDETIKVFTGSDGMQAARDFIAEKPYLYITPVPGDLDNPEQHVTRRAETTSDNFSLVQPTFKK